jgi:hypothetical protein
MRVRFGMVLGVVAAALAGCGSNSDCNLTPEVRSSTLPSSCELAPSSTVTVNVHWCSCGASTACDVTFDSGAGVYQLEPKVSSCDASCPPNPSSCPVDTVPCTFTTQSPGSYHLYVISGSSFVNVPLSIGGGNDTCGS